MKLVELKVNHVDAPLGFQITPLSFSWKIEDAGEAKKQKWTRLCIFCGKDTIFDSGEDACADSLDYQVDIKLLPRTCYCFSVEVMADNGETAKAESSFETGKMDEEWAAQWITPDMDAATPAVLKKTFTVDKASTARLYICGLGVYEAYINGQKAGDEFLAPGYHSYDFHLQAQVYDVSKYLKEGENEIEVWLADGWFRGRLGFDGGYTNLYGDKCYLIAELYADNKLLVKTDESWASKESPVVFSNIYDGEIYDANIADELKNTDNWNGVYIKMPKKCGALSDRYSLPIVKKETFDVITILHTPKNETVLDFRQEITGWVEFDCFIPKGMQIRLTASEIMQDNCFYNENYRTAKSEFVYRSNGKRAHVRPHFTFYGFRYMKVEYLDSEGNVIKSWEAVLKEMAFKAYHLRSDFDEVGNVETGNGKVNRLFLNALWSQKDNFLDVPTDCPQRDERLGWTGDAQVFSETACYNMFMPAFYRKYLWDMRAEQSILGGSVPNVVPRLKEGMVAEHGSCPWADAGVVIPWNVYLHYGSKTLLKECYPGMKAWVECERHKEEAIEGPHLIKDGFHFADWLSLDNPELGPFGATDPLYIASAYYYRCAKSVAGAAGVLGYDEDEKKFGKLASEIKEAIQEKYFDEDGLCVCHTQTGAAIAIEYGLIPERAKENLEADALAERVRANNNHLNTGFVGTSLLCPALTATGSNELAVTLLLNEDFPSWLYCVNLGAVTIWERWNSVLEDGHINPEGMNSLNHYSYGSIVAWMYKDLCGLRQAAPGFKRAVIKPHADKRLGYAQCVLNTSAGVYKSGWKYKDDGTVVYNVEVPFDAEAEFILDGKSQILTAGSYEF